MHLFIAENNPWNEKMITTEFTEENIELLFTEIKESIIDFQYYYQVFADLGKIYNSFLICIFFLGLVRARKKFLIIILTLEITLIYTFLSHLHRQKVYDESQAVSQIILVFGAIETAIGLRLLIDITRNKGRDNLKNIRRSKF